MANPTGTGSRRGRQQVLRGPRMDGGNDTESAVCPWRSGLERRGVPHAAFNLHWKYDCTDSGPWNSSGFPGGPVPSPLAAVPASQGCLSWKLDRKPDRKQRQASTPSTQASTARTWSRNADAQGQQGACSSLPSPLPHLSRGQFPGTLPAPPQPPRAPAPALVPGQPVPMHS